MRYIDLEDDVIARTVDAWQFAGPLGGLLALVPEAEKEKLPRLQAICRERGIALVGAVFPALLVDRHFVASGAWLLHFAHMPPYFLLPEINEGNPPAVRRLSSTVRDRLAQAGGSAHRPTLFMIFDGMLPNIASLLDGLYLDLANRVEYAGVNAGSESFQAMPCLFDDRQVVGNGVLGLLLPGETAPVLEHGFVSPERAMSATSTEGNRVAMIDWRPAFSVYRDLIQSEYGIELTRENFYQYAVHFPFGILRANGDVVVRIPVAVADDGSLYCVGEVPENTLLVLLKAPEAGAGACVERLATRLSADNGSLRDGQLLTFYCAGRRMHLGEAAQQELQALAVATGAAVQGGALSLGEIGSTSRWGYPMFHNATLVCSVWGKR